MLKNVDVHFFIEIGNMKNNMKTGFLLAKLALGVSALSVLSTSVTFAADTVYPSKPITIVVPHAPGGSVDSIARLFAMNLKNEIGETVVVENRAGASGMIGAGHVARSKPDGYTLYINASIHSINPLLYKDTMQFDAVKDFTPVSLLAKGALIFSVNPKVKANTPNELTELIKSDPENYSFATTGFGSAGHLAIADYRMRSDLTDIPIVLYKGGGPALQDVIGGQVTGVIDPMLSTLPQVRAGNLKAIAVTGDKRAEQLPDVPTMKESGFDDFEMYSWYGLWAPAGLPEPILEKLEAASEKVMENPDMINRLANDGFTVDYKDSAGFISFIDQEMGLYQDIIDKAEIKAN